MSDIGKPKSTRGGTTCLRLGFHTDQGLLIYSTKFKAHHSKKQYFVCSQLCHPICHIPGHYIFLDLIFNSHLRSGVPVPWVSLDVMVAWYLLFDSHKHFQDLRVLSRTNSLCSFWSNKNGGSKRFKSSNPIVFDFKTRGAFDITSSPVSKPRGSTIYRATACCRAGCGQPPGEE
jgi:hypothetical protein